MPGGPEITSEGQKVTKKNKVSICCTGPVDFLECGLTSWKRLQSSVLSSLTESYEKSYGKEFQFLKFYLSKQHLHHQAKCL